MKATARDRLCEAIAARGTTLAEVSRAIGKNHAYLHQYVHRGSPRRLGGDTVRKLALLLGIDEDALIDYQRIDPSNEASNLERPTKITLPGTLHDFVMVPEIRQQVISGGGVVVDTDSTRSQWPISRAYVSFFLGIDDANGLVLVDVGDDTMEPTLRPGDRVLVDTNNKVPTPPGVFMIWDGVGSVFRRVQHIPKSNPSTFRVFCDNPRYEETILTEEDTEIVGRVVWSARRL